MDVSVSALRANLSDWLERARSGEEIVVTERGIPVARLVGVDSAGILERLTNEGVIARPSSPSRPQARERKRPRVKSSVSKLVSDQRR
jgi:prevent-host-death family protein